MMCRLRAAALSILIGCAGAGPALAASGAADEASAAIDRGVALRRDHRDSEALVEFRRAYAIAPGPRALAQIGLAEGALEQWVQAEADLSRALEGDDPWIRKWETVLRATLSDIDAHIADLEVSGPDGAQLWIDGAFVATLPRPVLRVVAGRVVAELRLDGYRTERQIVDLVAGRPSRVAFTLVPSAEPSVGAPVEVPRAAESPSSEAPLATESPSQKKTFAAASDAAAARPPPPLAPPASPTSTTRAVRAPFDRRTAAWVSAGVFGAAAVASAAFTIYESDRVHRYDDDPVCGSASPAARASPCSSYADEFRIAQGGAIASYVFAGASAALTTFFFATLPGSRQIRCALGISAGSCSYAF